MIKLCLVAAVSNHNAIGVNGDLLWHYTDLPSDMEHFRNTTRGSVVLMGRKTWDSLGVQPLPRRTNVVVTSNPESVEALGAYAYNTVSAALRQAEASALDTVSKTVFVIGGGQIYKSLYGLADEMWISHVDTNLDGDTYFPLIREEDWNVETKMCPATIEHALGLASRDKYPFTIKHYTRIRQ